jgi:penicillin V acylase-like amidase (Ntn superfamily)
MAKVRLNIQIDETMKDYIEEQSDRLGVSQNGFINLCLAQYKEQKEVVQSMSNINEVVCRLERLQNKGE